MTRQFRQQYISNMVDVMSSNLGITFRTKEAPKMGTQKLLSLTILFLHENNDGDGGVS